MSEMITPMVERVSDALKVTMGRAVLKGERPSVEELARTAIEAMEPFIQERIAEARQEADLNAREEYRYR